MGVYTDIKEVVGSLLYVKCADRSEGFLHLWIKDILLRLKTFALSTKGSLTEKFLFVRSVHVAVVSGGVFSVPG